MKKNGNNLYEFEIDCSYDIWGLRVRCIKDIFDRHCMVCSLFGSGFCSKIACFGVEREDGFDVLFVPDLRM